MSHNQAYWIFALQYVVLLSDVIDAMDRHGEGVRFYMGHELGHLRLRHLSGHLLRARIASVIG